MNASTAGGSSPGGSFEGGGSQAPIYITPWGTKFHNYLSCPSLRNSRKIANVTFLQNVCSRSLRWPAICGVLIGGESNSPLLSKLSGCYELPRVR